jgi:hypothetical protein
MPAEKYSLLIPLDASGVEEFTPGEKIKILVQRRDGTVIEKIIEFSPEAKAEVTFPFTEHPGPLRIALGPAEATAEELLGMQTVTVDVPARVWAVRPKYTLEPIKIAPYYWFWWRRWCRTFTIRGRLLCPNGDPVPGATVCAYDVDIWWFWHSIEEVGCAVTDSNGTFEIKFRWCCVFLPWWWWRRRIWEIDPWLVRRIKPILDRTPDLRLGRLTNQPTLEVFAPLLAGGRGISKRPITAADAEMLEKIRPQLLRRLPPAPELEKLQLWPWWPWWPWRDCTPDIIFKATQDTVAPGTVILDEGVADTRWNIDDPLTVTLVANDQAYCRKQCPQPPCEDGECMVITDVCGDPIDSIGGNMGAPVSPAGYLNPGGTPPGVVGPGDAGYIGDRPFAGTVLVDKNYGDMVNVDYYTIEYQPDGDPNWYEVSEGNVQTLTRKWMQILFVPVPLPGHLDIHSDWVYFNWTRIDGHLVVESREHFEATGGLAGWDANRWWIYHRDLVVPLNSVGFADGTYNFRAVAFQVDAAGHLFNRRVLPICSTTADTYWVLTFDNRVVLDPDTPPTPPLRQRDGPLLHLRTRHRLYRCPGRWCERPALRGDPVEPGLYPRGRVPGRRCWRPPWRLHADRHLR